MRTRCRRTRRSTWPTTTTRGIRCHPSPTVTLRRPCAATRTLRRRSSSRLCVPAVTPARAPFSLRLLLTPSHECTTPGGAMPSRIVARRSRCTTPCIASRSHSSLSSHDRVHRTGRVANSVSPSIRLTMKVLSSNAFAATSGSSPRLHGALATAACVVAAFARIPCAPCARVCIRPAMAACRAELAIGCPRPGRTRATASQAVRHEGGTVRLRCGGRLGSQTAEHVTWHVGCMFILTLACKMSLRTWSFGDGKRGKGG